MFGIKINIQQHKSDKTKHIFSPPPFLFTALSSTKEVPLNSDHSVKIGGLWQNNCKLVFMINNNSHMYGENDFRCFWNLLTRDFKEIQPKNSQTWGHVLGHVDSPWGVDDDRHQNFSICSKKMYIGVVMAISREGSNPKKLQAEHWTYIPILGLHPSFEMPISPTFFEQIEKFQCHHLSCDIFTWHVSMCLKMCLQVCELLGWISLKSLTKRSTIFRNEIFFESEVGS